MAIMRIPSPTTGTAIRQQIDRLEIAKATIKSAIEGKGVTVPDASTLSAYAALIESIEAGGTPADYRGLPVVTGEITFASAAISAYKLEFPAGNRLRIKSGEGFINAPFFILVPSNDRAQSGSTGLKYIVQPRYRAASSSPNVYAFINWYAPDSAINANYMENVALTWGNTADSVNTSTNVDVTFTDVTIPCTTRHLTSSGASYRYILGVPIGQQVDEVEVV